MKVAVLASGRGSNLQALLDEWQDGRLPVEFVGVGSNKIDAKALVRAEKSGIQIRTFPRESYADKNSQETDILNWLEVIDTELLILAGYMQVLSPDFIRRAKYPILNIHPSLLPSFPGLHPQKQAVEYGVKVSGCTVHFVDEGMDSGPIILQEAVPVFAEDDADQLAARILKVEHTIYPEAVRLIVNGKIKREGRRVIVLRDS
ncbi:MULTISPECIES: phosphoribosylglycinamide formyltransferase [unclassified Dehalobacter]|uniref:phosphoribosylglycinamide formyltransferase n=1 Tax=unclassified Dehalobacter TaxID=2635733 RepID=UPI00037B331C|nr:MULTISPECIES: phosphoribosylglycinamide formyltransferase [unclassified Dehalobacter]RJE49238.1 phosphoribosylglycinamide formyltransferase [Dehalobacter sp. MCB1]TCX53283.1 phosphoribosylglycinamide formyltransferase [Dehalobacter sp. 14DCB1]TCX54297.1 phosphoribosylglycinamide formyltransferase [Dehalobacter sp. 12DCB1]